LVQTYFFLPSDAGNLAIFLGLKTRDGVTLLKELEYLVVAKGNLKYSSHCSSEVFKVLTLRLQHNAACLDKTQVVGHRASNGSTIIASAA
jgi:hypothetical protein